MKALLLTLGSHGDIHPFIAIGQALARRGCGVVLSTNPYFQPLIEGPEGRLEFRPMLEHQDLKKLITDNKVMDPTWGPIVVLRTLTLPAMPRMVERTRELIRECRPDVVIYHPIVMGSAWVSHLEGVPTVSVCPSPLMWANPADQLVLLPFRSHAPGPLAVGFDRLLGRWFMRLALDPASNRLRRQLGLPPRTGNFHLDCTAANLNLGIWSPMLRPPLPGDPANSLVTGATWHDRDQTQSTPDDELLAFLDAGPPPLVFALGSTGVHASARFYHHAAEACRRLKQRGLLVVGRDQPGPTDLPPGVKAVPYAPFSVVFPRAAAVVHHGGAGTTNQALRAGRPTVITPMAHDQFDNAARVKRLGASETLRFSQVTPARLESALSRVLSESSFARSAATLADRIDREDGAEAAAERIVRDIPGFHQKKPD